jgi:hypothetical protein
MQRFFLASLLVAIALSSHGDMSSGDGAQSTPAPSATWSDFALLQVNDACGQTISEDSVNPKFITYTYDTNDIDKKCTFLADHADNNIRYVFDCNTQDICSELQQYGPPTSLFPSECNFMSGESPWSCSNRDKTPAALSLEQLEGDLPGEISDAYTQMILQYAGADARRLADYIDPVIPTDPADVAAAEDRWWNLLHLATFTMEPQYFTWSRLFMDNRFETNYFDEDFKEYFTTELDTTMTDEQMRNPVMAEWYLHNTINWERNDLPQEDGWQMFPTAEDCPACRTTSGWDYKEVQRKMYTWYSKSSHCIANNEQSSCPVQSCYWNTYWNVCQHPYVGYSSPSTSECPVMTCDCEEGTTLVEEVDPTTGCITCSCQANCASLTCPDCLANSTPVEVTDGNGCVVSCGCEGMVVTEVMFNGQSTTAVLFQYQEELRLGWANALGIHESQVTIENIGAAELDFGSVPQMNFGWVWSEGAYQAYADSDTFFISWQNELKNIQGLNVILGLTSSSLSGTISDGSASGFQMDLEMIGADSSKKVWWTVAAGSAQQPSASEIMTGTGLCDGSVSQAATYSAYIQCGLVHDSTYVVYIYFGDSTDGGTVFISFETDTNVYIPYQYTFAGVTYEQIQPYMANVNLAFSQAIGVLQQYVREGSSGTSNGNAVVQIMFPLTSYTTSVTGSSGFVVEFETIMSMDSDLSGFVTTAVPAYQSVGGYVYQSQSDAEAACNAASTSYSLCSKSQLYTIVYSNVGGFSKPDLCYSGWTSDGQAGWYHNQAGTGSTVTCGGADGWQTWQPAQPGAHCCTGFTAIESVKEYYMPHPDRYAFATKDEAAAACQALDSDYYLCSRYQVMGLVLSPDYDYNMCVGGWYDDGTADGAHGFYVGSEDSDCNNGIVGWHQWCRDGLCAAHCCLPSYLDERTQMIFFGTSVDSNGDSTFDAATNFCAAEEYFPEVCTMNQLRAISHAENMNICKPGWLKEDSTDTVGVVGWYQGEYTTEWCGQTGWNTDTTQTHPVAHCCAPYAIEYERAQVDHQIFPSYYSGGYSTGQEAVQACKGLGFDDLCTKGQVIWIANNDTPNLCRSGWVYKSSVVDGLFDVGYQGYPGCESDGMWNTWQPSTPVAHCCMSTVIEEAHSSDPYLKMGSYVYSTAEDAAQACGAAQGYSLCTYEQLYRVAYEDVDGFSNTNICYSGWLADGFAGWWQFSADYCGGRTGWRDWMLSNTLAGAHCCEDFEGSPVPGVLTTTLYPLPTLSPTLGLPPDDCPYLTITNGDAAFNGVYTRTGISNGKYQYALHSQVPTLLFDGEVWTATHADGHTFVARGSVDGLYPPATATWDYVQADQSTPSTQAYTAVQATCVNDLYNIYVDVSGLVSGQTITFQMQGNEDVLIEYPSTQGTFLTGIPEGYAWEVTYVQGTTAYCTYLNPNSGVMTTTDVYVNVDCIPTTYLLGGSISGLKGTAILHSAEPGNNPQVYAVSTDGSFSFPARFTTGETYNVLVAVNPDGQTCSVENGVGEIVDQTINNVVIECEDNEYKVGVTVSGLNPDGSAYATLIRRPDVITTSVDGYYEFPTLQGYGSTYLVSVGPIEGYSCTMQNHYGTITGDVTDVRLDCVELVGTQYRVEVVFYQIRDCTKANSIQMSEFKIYNVDGVEIPITDISSTPANNPSHGSEGVQNLIDDNVLTKWLDYTLGTCGETLRIHDIYVDDEPFYFNFATANDMPDRDPKEFQVNICNVVGTTPVSCKSLYYLLDDLPLTRGVFQSPVFSMESYRLTVTVNGNVGPAVIQNVENFNGDAMTFNQPGTGTFLYEVNVGSSYDVTILSDPPNQMCVTSGVASGTMTGPISVNVYCSEACDAPVFLDELESEGLPKTLVEGLCITNDRYFWNGQDLCVGAVEESRSMEVCDSSSMVCAGALGRTYGTYNYQVELILEAFDTTETCLADYEACNPTTNNECCSPYSACLWTFDATQVSSSNQGFASKCIPCNECYEFINHCDEVCAGKNGDDPVRHPRCPPASCEVIEDSYEPRYFEDEVSYCLSGTMIYMNGMMTCVDVTNPNYTTTEDQNRQLEFYWYNDYEFGTDECSANEKSGDLLVQDHVYISNQTLIEFQKLTDNAIENCCLAGDDVDEGGFTINSYKDDWQEQIAIINSQINVYSSNITAQIASIVGQLNYLQMLLQSV